jgi:UDP-N-acetylmuramoylalanine--D-glutamate ligase
MKKFKSFLVLGLGKTGLSVVEFLSKLEKKVLIWDDNQIEKSSFKSIDDIDWNQIDVVVQSPGISFSYPIPHKITALAQSKNIPIVTDINLLQTYIENVENYVAVTGTNGKSTTTALLGEVLCKFERDVKVGGNIGTPALSFDFKKNTETFVLELSSFQLEISTDIKLDTAIWLNITPDHLDRHGNINSYVQAKANIFKNCKRALVSIDDEYSKNIYKKYKDRLEAYSFSLKDHNAFFHVKDGYIYAEKQKFFNLNECENLIGEHNWQNMLAVFSYCYLKSYEPYKVFQYIKDFSGLQHRQQKVGFLDGVTFINDSKATSASATSTALKTFLGKDIFWILGGRAKTDGINDLESFFPHIKHAFLIGESQKNFAKFMDGKLNYSIESNLESAVKNAFTMAKKSKNSPVVLFSPACASFDQFKNFEHRGDVFTQIVASYIN